MRILIVAPLYPPDRTGSSVLAHQQAARLVAMGHEVLVVANSPDRRMDENDFASGAFAGPSKLIERRVSCFRLNLGPISWNYRVPIALFGAFSVSLWKQVRSFRPDIVINHSTLFDLNVIFLMWSCFSKVRGVIVGHSALWHDIKL